MKIVALGAGVITISVAAPALVMANMADDGGGGSRVRVVAAEEWDPPEGGPGKCVKEPEAMSDEARTYQSQVSGAPQGWVYKIGEVKFDGYKNGVLKEAKDHYKQFLTKGAPPSRNGSSEGLTASLSRPKHRSRAIGATESSGTSLKKRSPTMQEALSRERRALNHRGHSYAEDAVTYEREGFYAGVYSPGKGESLEVSVQRTEHMFKLIKDIDPTFRQWYDKGWTLEEALERRLDLDRSDLAAAFDTHKSVGFIWYSLSAWNGMDDSNACDFHVSCGHVAPSVDDVIFNLNETEPTGERVLQAPVMIRLLRALVSAWDPQMGIVISQRHRDTTFEHAKFEHRIGWINYFSHKLGAIPPSPALSVPSSSRTKARSSSSPRSGSPRTTRRTSRSPCASPPS